MTGNREIYEQAMDEGHNATWDQEWPKAIAAYQRAIQESPEDITAQLSLGNALIQAGRLADALNIYQRAHKLAPEDPIPVEHTANLLGRMGQPEAASQQYITAAEIYLAQHDLGRAIDNWEQATRVTPGLIPIHHRLAQAYERTGQHKLAIHHYLILAVHLQKANRTEVAIQAVERALRIEPANSQALSAIEALRSGTPIPPLIFASDTKSTETISDEPGDQRPARTITFGSAKPRDDAEKLEPAADLPELYSRAPAQVSDVLTPPPITPASPPMPPAYAPEPSRDMGAKQPRQKAKKEAAVRREAPPTAPPHFSAYYPSSVGPKRSYALMAFVHLESARDQVREVAAGFVDLMGGQQKSESTPSAIRIDVGSLITFVPQIPGITFTPAEQVAIWTPPYQSVTFPFTTPADLKTDLEGRIQVYHGPLIVGEIPVRIAVQEAVEEPKLDATSDLERYDPIFASYSHKDTPVMEYFRRARENLGQKMLVDVYDLRAGEHWEPRLLEMIEGCAVFQLFWSRHSAQSTYCRQEWEHALHCGANRERFIQPVWWEQPMPPPPPELADLHFQRIVVPTTTRMQLTLARIKALFGRE